jgi:acetolactate synthase-1/2/3 large subunit
VRGALIAAERPAIVLGARAGGRADLAARLPATVARLAEALRAPVFTSPAAKGLAHVGQPWFAGTFLNGNPEASVLERCDVVLAVGLDAVDFFNVDWRYPATILAVEPDPTNTQRFVPASMQVVCNLADLGEPSGRSAWQISDVAAYRAELARLLPQDDEQLTIPTALGEARAVLPTETLLTVDAGFGKPLTAYLWPAREPNSCFTSHGLSTMGYAIPAANALKLVHPERPVLAVLGDGSLLMRACEIGVAAELGLAPIYVVWIDASLSQIEIKQRRQGLRPVGMRFPRPRCARIADAFGGVGWDVETRADFRAALREALNQAVPSLIGARVDQSSHDAWFDLIRG